MNGLKLGKALNCRLAQSISPVRGSQRHGVVDGEEKEEDDNNDDNDDDDDDEDDDDNPAMGDEWDGQGHRPWPIANPGKRKKTDENREIVISNFEGERQGFFPESRNCPPQRL